MGFRFGDWLRLLSRHGFDPVYLPRVLLTTPCTIATSGLAFADRRIMATAELNEQHWRSPVFLLGLPRSGTTQLLYLLAAHDGWTSPTRLDAYNPHSFLTLRKLGITKWRWLATKASRVVDNVKVGWNQPEEDDFAIFVMTGIRGRIWRTFPTELSPLEAGEYFTEESRHLATAWKKALMDFTRKLVFAHNAQLVLKSPSHTMKIPEILEVFPAARFVTIFREPMSHFRSFRAMLGNSGTGWGELRRRPEVDDEALLEVNARQLRRYFETRSLIPEGNLCEIRHEDLNANPAATLHNIFSKLKIEGWDCFHRKFSSHWDAPYRKNRHPDLSERLQDLIKKAYSPLYERGIYRL